ncbi:unnamed protein product [Adineta ricciae]|uniref:Uncharacterized protein n=1 Tax=Adineta ricciae TaxID=249248 RepID=A0A815S8F5_ADIRI|nr:unnamed protein product [Adineta ricciae]CAF1655589.1 unnamed protein product [Adineta ricciae]
MAQNGAKLGVLERKSDLARVGVNVSQSHGITLYTGPQITINELAIDRAIYFHGYLLEQTLESIGLKSNRLSNAELKASLIREILMFPEIIITKEALYAYDDSFLQIEKHLIVPCTDTSETLVTDCLLIHDYFLFTNTHRPIKCYAKVLPNNAIDTDSIQRKLQRYNVQLTDYIVAARASGVQLSSSLTTIGKALLCEDQYSKISDITTVLSDSTSTYTIHRTIPLNAIIPVRPQQLNHTSSNITDETQFTSAQETTHVSRNSLVVKRCRAATGAIQQDLDMAHDTDIISFDDLLSK